MDKRQFILDTLLPYKEDITKCAVIKYGSCEYLTDDGRKCAVGMHMKPGPWQLYVGDVVDLFEEYNSEDILTDDALSMRFTAYDWKPIQKYHDTIANFHKNQGDIIISPNVNKEAANDAVRHMESIHNIKLPELLIELD